MPSNKQIVSIDNKKLTLSNMDKVLFPESKIVKAELINYYLNIAPHFIDFAIHRPISMIRYPDGITKEKFYSKNKPDFAPEFIKSRKYTDDDIHYSLVDSRPALLWMANLASLELHADNLTLKTKNPLIDHFIIDLDPPANFTFAQLKLLTTNIVDVLVEYGMTPFVKTSGSKGLHIYIPIEKITPSDAFFEKLDKLAKRLVDRFPKQATLAFRKNKREGKILIDVLRNHVSQTCVLPFSTRAIEGAPVSMPIFFEDLDSLESSQDFNIFNASDYLKEKGNPWKDFHLEASDFFGVQAQKKKQSKIIPLEENWFDEPSFSHQLASEVNELPSFNRNVVFENKWDGIRVFIYVNGKKVKILSRNNRDITSQFRDVIKDFKVSKTGKYVFDAEIISPNKQGKPIFTQVISRLHQKSTSTAKYPALAYVFDIIISDGVICTKETWERRRKFLENSLLQFPQMKLSEVYSDGELLLNAVKNMGMEGIMIKKKNAKYALGERNSNWNKLKIRHEVECYIIGYTAGSGDRSAYFGSLHLVEEKDNELKYRGKVGTGWDRAKLKELFEILDPLEKTEEIPFDEITDTVDSTWFAKPYKGCRIKYASFSSTGTYREPVFLEMNDKKYE